MTNKKNLGRLTVRTAAEELKGMHPVEYDKFYMDFTKSYNPFEKRSPTGYKKATDYALQKLIDKFPEEFNKIYAGNEPVWYG